VQHKLLSAAQIAQPSECFGFLIEKERNISFLQLPGYSDAHWFTASPQELIDVAYQLNANLGRVKATFHSHPEGNLFSERDRMLGYWAPLHVLAIHSSTAPWRLVTAEVCVR